MSTLESTQLTRPQLLMWIGTAACVSVWMALIVGAPVALAYDYSYLATIIYKGFSPFCHQIPERSFHIEGHAFAVCSRCTGIYAGVAAGVIAYPVVRSLRRTDTPARFWLLLATVPIILDWTVGFLGIWENTHLSRSLTGGLLGAVAAFYIVPGLMDVLRTDWRGFFKKEPATRVQSLKTTSPVSPDRVAPSDYGSPSSRI